MHGAGLDVRYDVPSGGGPGGVAPEWVLEVLAKGRDHEHLAWVFLFNDKDSANLCAGWERTFAEDNPPPKGVKIEQGDQAAAQEDVGTFRAGAWKRDGRSKSAATGSESLCPASRSGAPEVGRSSAQKLARALRAFGAPLHGAPTTCAVSAAAPTAAAAAAA
jgi:hypothetical protein